MSMCRAFSCVVGRRCLLWPVYSLGNSISLGPASFHTPRPNLPVSWLPIFCIPVPYNEKDIFFWVLVLKNLVSLRRTVQLQLLQHYWWGHRLGLPWYWVVCLGNERRSFCHFWDCIQVLHFRLFCWPRWYSISSKWFLPLVVDIMVIRVKFSHSSPWF